MTGEHRGVDLGHGIDLKNAVDLTRYLVLGSGLIPAVFPDHVRRLQEIEEEEDRRTYQTRQSYRMEATFIKPRTELERRRYARTLAWMRLQPAKLKPLIHNGRKPRG